MIQISHEVKGFEELYEKLKALSNPIVAKEALREGLRLGGKQVQFTAKILCPVDEGQLRNSITVESVPDEGNEVRIKVGTNVEYGPYIEFGTGIRGDETDIPSKAVYNPSYTLAKERKKNGKKTGITYPYLGMKPIPYLYPALAANTDNVLNLVKTTLQEEIRKR